MPEIKWIKLTTDIFDDEKIRLIEAMPDADTLLIIWIKLLCQAGKVNADGYIFLSRDIPFTDDNLATLFSRPINTIRLALATFQRLSMLNVDEKGVIYLPNWSKHQNIQGMDRIREGTRLRQQKHRLKLNQGNITLERDNYICQYCGLPATGVDHLLPKTKGGKDDDPNNQVACCVRCNHKKMTQTVANFLNGVILFNEYEITIESILVHPILRRFVYYQDGKFYDINNKESRDTSQDVTYQNKNKNKKENKNNTIINNRDEISDESISEFTETIEPNEKIDVLEVSDNEITIGVKKNPPITEVFARIDKIRGYRPPKRAAEAASILRMLKTYSPDQIITTWQNMKKDSFWAGKELYMMSVESQIGARLNGNGKKPVEQSKYSSMVQR